MLHRGPALIFYTSLQSHHTCSAQAIYICMIFISSSLHFDSRQNNSHALISYISLQAHQFFQCTDPSNVSESRSDTPTHLSY